MPFAAVDGLRVREALELPCFSGAVVIAGHEGLDRVVRHVTVVDTPGPYKWIRGDELLLTAAYFLKNEPEAQLSMIPELAPLGVAAIAMKLGRYVDYMPPAMIDHADRYGLPLIELPYEVAWIDIINPVMAEILNRQASILKESKQSHEMLMKLVLDGCGLPEIATRLSSLIDRPR
jgi:purine catabolism regulator